MMPNIKSKWKDKSCEMSSFITELWLAIEMPGQLSETEENYKKPHKIFKFWHLTLQLTYHNTKIGGGEEKYNC
jgi:hypothetical protein